MNLQQKLKTQKNEALGFLDLLPIKEMEAEIDRSHDPFIQTGLKNLKYTVTETENPRYRKIYWKLGVCLLWAKLDGAYGEFIEYMAFHTVHRSKVIPKTPRSWHVNNYKE